MQVNYLHLSMIRLMEPLRVLMEQFQPGETPHFFQVLYRDCFTTGPGATTQTKRGKCDSGTVNLKLNFIRQNKTIWPWLQKIFVRVVKQSRSLSGGAIFVYGKISSRSIMEEFDSSHIFCHENAAVGAFRGA